MSRKTLAGWAMIVVLVVTGAVCLRGQDVPEPPEPPDPPDSSEVFVLGDGTVHLGVTLSDVTAEKAQELKLPAAAGALVDSVEKDSAASKAGLQAGDVIVEFDGVRVRGEAELRRLIHETPAGRTLEMKIVRDGKTRVLSAKLETASKHYSFQGPNVNITVPEIHIPPMDFSLFGDRRATLGISAENLTPQLAQYFGVKQGKGVLISEVTAGGAADKAGLKAGDVIVQVDGKPVSCIEELRSALNDNFEGDTRKCRLTIVRDRHEQTVSADLTRTRSWGKRTYSTTQQDLGRAMAEMQRAQADQQRAQAEQLRREAERQRALVQAEVAKQEAREKAEWQRQLQEQMRALKDQVRQMQNLRVTLHQDGEI